MRRISVKPAADPSWVARYRVLCRLGQGGMAAAYRVYDTVAERELALKRLVLPDDARRAERSIELFEREFHTLVQLAHPRVVQAYDYGVDGATPYYTMELLDGGDLGRLSPLPWQQVCTVAYEISSVLSLLHSRHLVHRDLTPNNIRRTADGKAKVIDFGLLAPMGPTGLVAGTPPYVAPEVLDQLTLDGRSDLFSLGATLYYALTGRTAFPARRFDALRDAWRNRPPAPSAVRAGIPPALDDLVLALMRIDVNSRPKSAAEVMERLLPMLAAPPAEELTVARAYLTTPQLVGRDDGVEVLRKQLVDARRGHGGGIVVMAEPGVGRSRMLDAFVLEAKLAGATTLRASAADATGPFGVAATLIAQAHATNPQRSIRAASDPQTRLLLFDDDGSLRDLTNSSAQRAALQAALRGWFFDVASEAPLAIAADDIHLIDEPSAALLAALVLEAGGSKLAVAASLERGAEASAPNALSVLRKHATLLGLAPLDTDGVTALLSSVFGDVPNLHSLSTQLYGLCGGRPRECMVLAQHLVDQGAIEYADGTWVLPSELAPQLLPPTLDEALRQRVHDLSPVARHLALLLSLGILRRHSRAQLMQLDGATPVDIDRALDELLSCGLVIGGPSGYALAHDRVVSLVSQGSSENERHAAHETLATLYAKLDEPAMRTAYHLLHSRDPEAGLDHLFARAGDSDARTALSTSVPGQEAARTLQLAVGEAERRNRPRRHLQALWVMLAGMSAQGEDVAHYYGIPAAWLEQLKHDSGFDDWQRLDHVTDPAERALKAFSLATERYQQTPEHERVQEPADAIKQLLGYVVFSIAVSVRTLDLELQASLPELLEPFAPLNPLVAAMWGNARGTCMNGDGRREQARETFVDVLRQLDSISGIDLAYIDRIRAAICQTLAEIDSSLGLQTDFTDRLANEEQDRNQAVSAAYIQKVVALQQGDWEAAERHRQRAELLMLQTNEPSMFSTLGQELEVHAMAQDLTGLRQARTAIHGMAARHPGWVPVKYVADAHYERLRGDSETALAAVEAARAWQSEQSLCSPWVRAASIVEAEVLVDCGRADEALRCAQDALALCRRDDQRHLARALRCACALAEARLGRFEDAKARLEGVLAEQTALGVTGLQLGRSYEHLARIAVWEDDRESFAAHCARMAEHYRPGNSSVLGALYERLLEEAEQTGVGALAAELTSPTDMACPASQRARVLQVMASAEGPARRAERALALLCESARCEGGHLYLLSEAGLGHAASQGARRATGDLDAAARELLEMEMADASLLTRSARSFQPGPSDEGMVSRHLQDPDGTRYLALVLGARLGDAFRVAGVALLIDHDERPDVRLTQLAAELARYLVQCGDVPGTVAA